MRLTHRQRAEWKEEHKLSEEHMGSGLHRERERERGRERERERDREIEHTSECHRRCSPGLIKTQQTS